jgi:hypothetical protein
MEKWKPSPFCCGDYRMKLENMDFKLHAHSEESGPS